MAGLAGSGRPQRRALIVVDMQKAFEEIAARGARRNNPQAELRMAELIAAFRASNAPIIHVRHASREPRSPFRSDRPGHAVQDFARERGDEAVIVKEVNSSFIGTNLEAKLRSQGIDEIVLVGATTNHCVETTARMAGNLGFRTFLVRDATFTFDSTGPDGEPHRAEDIHQMTLANLSGEFAEIVTAQEMLTSLGCRAA
jgi:nicotinamidase-related amidase